MREISGSAFFEKAMILIVNLVKCFFVLFSQRIQMLEESGCEHLVEFLHQGAVLHGFTRNIQREILAVDHPLEETAPFWEKLLRLGLDQNLTAVEVHLTLTPCKAHAFHVLGGHIEQ